MSKLNEKDELEFLKKATSCNDITMIGLNDTFGFKCKQCGKCCMNREDIILNPFDIYNAAKYLNISTIEFVDKYTKPTIGGHSKMPMVLLRTTENGFCPFLNFDVKNGGKFKCTIHDAKPGACSNHPIGIAYSFDKLNKDSDTRFIKVEQCSNSISNEMHTVKDWIQPYFNHKEEIDIAHEIQLLSLNYFNARTLWLLFQINLAISDTIKNNNEFNKDTSDTIKKVVEEYTNISISLSYVSYDINKPFIEQAKNNIEKLDSFYTKIKELYEYLKQGFENIIEKIIAEEEFDNPNIYKIIEELRINIQKEKEEN